VRASDGVRLHVEVDEPPGGGRATVVFVHGYSLNLDCWHFQRQALRPDHRLVLFDQRSHGRSQRGPASSATIEQLGRDLRSVLDATADGGPVVLVAHSMGGMTVMALAEQEPALFGTAITAVCLISSSAGDLSSVTLGLPGLPGRLMHRGAPAVTAVLARAPGLVESGRRAGSDLGYVLTRRLAFGTPVPAALVEFTDEMLASTPVDVVAEFFPGFQTHERYETLAVLRGVPTLVLCGSRDRMTPIDHSRKIAELLPDADFEVAEGAGHMVMLECHQQVTRAIRHLVDRAVGSY
jgi:pimeloyl-ACP methyl ester carboxylesterase